MLSCILQPSTIPCQALLFCNRIQNSGSTFLLEQSSWLDLSSLKPATRNLEFSVDTASSLSHSFATILEDVGKYSALSGDITSVQDSLLGITENPILSGFSNVDILTSPQDNTLPSAQNIGTMIGARGFGGQVSASDSLDLFKFQLDAQSDINLMLSGLTADADLYLIWDGNGNGSIDSGEILDGSIEAGTSVEAISFDNLPSTTFYIAVAQFSGSTNYTLHASASPDGGIHHQAGGLRADGFGLAQGHTYSVISGNGNVDFGQGHGDILDLSRFSTNSVVSWNPASASGGGVIYNPGNGSRVFDALGLST
jgi:hypothetical protein